MADFELDLSELDSEADVSERAAPKRPSSQPSFKPRPGPGTPSGVTQAQLEAALSRVDGKIKTVADGVSTLSSRVGSLASATKKEVDERKKTVDNTGKDMNSKLMLLALLPALTQPTYTIPPVQIPSGANLPGIPGGPTTAPVPLQYVPASGQAAGVGNSVDVSADTNTLNLLLPLLAVSGSGLGFGTDSTGGSGGFDNSAMMMLVLVLALSGVKK
jgi:hypothetical protein